MTGGFDMTRWLDQKHIERRIIGCSSWQAVLDELERPNEQFTPRHASTILRRIADEYMRIQKEAAPFVNPSIVDGFTDEQVIIVACEEAVDSIRLAGACSQSVDQR